MPIIRRAPTIPTPRGRRLALKVITGAAIVQAAFLVALLVALAADSRGAIKLLLPLALFGYIYLLYLVASGASRGRWGWWYMALTAGTAGAPGALIGARRLRTETAAEIAAEAPVAPARPTRKEQRKAAAEQRRASGDR
ncbi:MAG: hypothetical protein QOH72_3354 [Solirubrobacteraceae bacterium]|jgi:hypothetical protein|nr:hypothetical protein [Solirubrobacteraceae bacterium]